MKFISLILASLFLAPVLMAGKEPRQTLPLKKWGFIEDSSPLGTTLQPPQKGTWQPVDVPHIFRQSGLPDNSAGWYQICFEVGQKEHDRSYFLKLDGAASIKDVFLNGKAMGQHKGSFTASTFDLTPALNLGGTNTLAVRVSNRDEECKGILARSNLYAINGGMFRKAWLIKTGKVGIFPESGSSGIFLTASNITAERADLEMRSTLRNATPNPVKVLLRQEIFDPSGQSCGKIETPACLGANTLLPVSATFAVNHPALWDLAKPNLYSVRTEVSVDGKPTDAVTERTGFRTIAWKDGKFLLNGHPALFLGVNKHEQNEIAWNAVDDENSRHEFQLMKEMGINFVRLAHYPHSQLEYSLADENGLGIWAENGFSGQTWKGAQPEDKVFSTDGERLTREMVRQLWNHPSILFWSCGNETVVDIASRYAEVIREEKDPNRLITYATNAGDPKNCDFVAKNTYDGWYGGTYDGFGTVPRNSLISETGAGSWPSQHVPYGTAAWKVNQFEPEEYAEIFAEYRLQMVCATQPESYPLFTWWIFRDFYDLKFKNNRNTKGLLTLSGQPKDLYYLFQAFLNPQKPVLHLSGLNHFFRRFAPNNGIKVYSNSKEVELFINGVSQGWQVNGSYYIPDIQSKQKDGSFKTIPGIPVNHVFFWKAPLAEGRNVILVRDQAGNKVESVLYQESFGTKPAEAHGAIVQNLQSSNPENPARLIDRPIEPQSPFYLDVDGSSDNTFDSLPPELEGASWIATRRMSDPKLQTDLQFNIDPNCKGASVYVLHSIGTYPVVTLKHEDESQISAASTMDVKLKAEGFKQCKEPVTWRDHELERSEASMWRLNAKPGDSIKIPGATLDYVVLIKAFSASAR